MMYLQVFAGLALLLTGAELLVRGAVTVARRLGGSAYRPSSSASSPPRSRAFQQLDIETAIEFVVLNDQNFFHGLTFHPTGCIRNQAVGWLRRGNNSDAGAVLVRLHWI